MLWAYEWPKHCKKGSACDRLCEYHICISEKEYECDGLAAIGYIFLGSGKLDSEVIRNTHPRSILPFIEAERLK